MSIESLESRLRRTEVQVSDMSVAVARINESVSHIDKSINDLVTKDRFAPVAYIAYGLAGGVLTTFIGAVTAMVFIK